MKPIRKDEQIYLKEYINRKFDNHRSHLESERQIDVDNTVDRNLSKFRKTLNLNDMIRTITKLSSEYVDFVDNYESRKLDKKRRLIEAGEKLQKKLSKWQSVRRWEKTPDFVGKLSSDDTPVDVDDIDKFLAISKPILSENISLPSLSKTPTLSPSPSNPKPISAL